MRSLDDWGGALEGYLIGPPVRCPACQHVREDDGRRNRLRDVRVYRDRLRVGVDCLVTCGAGHNWLFRVESDDDTGELRAVFVAVDAYDLEDEDGDQGQATREDT